MFIRCVTYALIFFSIEIPGIFGKSTSLGKLFVFQPNERSSTIERTEASTDIFLYTLSSRSFVVDVSTPWIEGREAIKTSVRLERLIVSVLKVGIETLLFQNAGSYKFSYKLEGSAPFGVLVFLLDGYRSADSFLAVPVSGWGTKYVIYTKGSRPAFTITTVEENAIDLHVKLIENRILDDGELYINGEVKHIALKEYQSYSCGLCNFREDFSGTIVESVKPVGVITGNCFAFSHFAQCDSNITFDDDSSADIIAEMMLPISTLGTEYISLVTPRRLVEGGTIIVSVEANTTIKISNLKDVFLSNKGDKTEIFLERAHAITSDKPIAVLHLQSSACLLPGDRLEDGDPALCIVIPNSLFYDGYIWSTPFLTADLHPNNFAVIFVKTVEKKYVYLDGEVLSDTTIWQTVVGKDDYILGDIQVSHGSHNLYGIRVIYFGCYIYGTNLYYSYMNPGGFISTEVNIKKCVPTFNDNARGDLVDNDCDGIIDEEAEDGEDNDHDNRIDEDLAKPPRRDGGWGEWLEWECVTGCLTYNFRRVRFCNNPTPENDGEYCPGDDFDRRGQNERDCGFGKMCPTDCPVGRWHYGCEKSCDNCEQDCDKFNGNCTTCKPGFTDAASGCSQSCPQFTFGPRCNGNCIAKCMTECLDKISGACPPTPVNNMVYLWWLVLLLPIAGVIVYLLRKQSEIAANAEGEM